MSVCVSAERICSKVKTGQLSSAGVSNDRDLAQTVVALDHVMMSTGSGVIIQLDYQLRPGLRVCKAGFVSKLLGRDAAVNLVFVGLAIGVVRTNPYWQQFHGVNSALYLLANWAFGFLAFPGKHLAIQPNACRALLSACASDAFCD